MRLAVISHVVHYRHEGVLYAYGPYAREIEIWADLFDAVLIAAPCREGAVPGDAVPLTRPNISIAPQRMAGGETLAAKVKLLLSLPLMMWELVRVLRRTDAVHVRCPGNLGLLGVVLAPLFSRRVVAKYAGQWPHYPGEPLSVSLQKRLLRSSWWNGPVTVYGDWPGEPPHVVPFFTSIMTEAQQQRAKTGRTRRGSDRGLRVLYTGRVAAGKNLEVLVRAFAQLKASGVNMNCSIVGDGPERDRLMGLAEKLGVKHCIEFPGAVPFERIPDFLEQSDVLFLASENEGWPKALAEAMAFGLICIGSERGLIPQMLEDQRGIVVPSGDVDALCRALERIAQSPGEYEEMRTRAAAWGQQFTLEGLREALRSLLVRWWDTRALSTHAS